MALRIQDFPVLPPREFFHVHIIKWVFQKAEIARATLAYVISAF